MKNNEAEWMRLVRRLEASYAVDGRDGLAKMTGIEAYLLYEEKAVALEAAEKMLAEKPGPNRWDMRRDQLAAEVGDIEAWLKKYVSPFNDQDAEDRGREKDKDRGLER